MSTVTVDQSGASAENDIVGGNKTEHNHYNQARKLGVVEILLVKLEAEIEQNQQARETIERLQRFHKAKVHDGVAGLQAKLTAGGRDSEYEYAIEMKEAFAKLLDKWALYASAQQIFAYLLARAEQRFSAVIIPALSSYDKIEINQLVATEIVDPTVDDCGASVFEIDHNVAMGMLYWLAEQCYVRWHK